MVKIDTSNITLVSYGTNRGLLARNKKGFLQLFVPVFFLLGVGAVSIFLYNQFGPNAETASIGSTANSENNKIPSSVIPSTGKSTFSFNALDLHDKTSGLVYLAGTGTAFGQYSGKTSFTLTNVSTPTTSDFVVDEKVAVLMEASSYYPKYETGISSMNALKSVQFELPKSSTPELKVKDIEANAFVGTWNSTTKNIEVPSISLTAGGASKSYVLYARVDTTNSQFGDTGILVADDASPTKYNIGTTMGTLGTSALSNSMVNSNKKNVYKAPRDHVKNSDGLVEVGTVTISLKAGQSGSDVKYTFYDQTRFLSVDGTTVNIGVEKDDSSATDIGSTNPSITFKS